MSKLALVMAVLVTLALLAASVERSKAHGHTRRRGLSKRDAIARTRIMRGLRRSEERDRKQRKSPEITIVPQQAHERGILLNGPDRESRLLITQVFTRESLSGHSCFECGKKAALFVVKGHYLGDCPSCIVRRICALKLRGAAKQWMEDLLWEAEKEVKYQEKKENETFALNLDDFYRCHRCDRVIHQNDARYFFPPGTTSSHPYCIECRAALAAEPEPLPSPDSQTSEAGGWAESAGLYERDGKLYKLDVVDGEATASSVEDGSLVSLYFILGATRVR